MSSLSTITAFVDRVADATVTLLLGDEESVVVTLPRAWLPSGVHEGQVLQLAISVDAHQSAARTQQVQALLDELGDAP